MSCVTPYWKRHKTLGHWIPHNCGKCAPCERRRVQQWVFRIQHEMQDGKDGVFITLTYDDDNIPIAKCGFGTLDVNDTKKYWKRIRRKYDVKFKYYLCGEYGEQTNRPHYHAIVIGHGIDVIDFEASWKLGHVHIGNVSSDSIAYCIKYFTKNSYIGKQDWDDRKKCFSAMSHGIGADYIKNPQVRKWHKSNLENITIASKDGKSDFALPRYYKDKLFTDEEKVRIRNYVVKKFPPIQIDVLYSRYYTLYKKPQDHGFYKWVHETRMKLIHEHEAKSKFKSRKN